MQNLKEQRRDKQADLMKRTLYADASSAALPLYFAPLKYAEPSSSFALILFL
ncbi:hypothetical protein [Chryseobacterium sp. SORGH_AS_0447]|uniref:hypothetical protein n=1 Tax=Chryseobacterium sp. SORGH_AS_0447 TaxID=3041769 RepID=UPI0027D89D57|nr:hypothetical protein [Chryseobacterium sp. SORGH_AS_0447]